jgi:hypothetical protein
VPDDLTIVDLCGNRAAALDFLVMYASNHGCGIPKT